jgi:penicillin-binding protein 1A
MTKMRKRKKVAFNFIAIALLIAIFIGAIFAISVYYALRDLPSIDVLKNYQPAQSTLVYDRNNKLLGRFYDERRTVIPLASLPKTVPQAFVAAEDGDFYEHAGIDYFGILRAFLLELKYRTIGGRRVGGSTITQQTARTMLLTSEQTYLRKLKEIALARRIEKALSKEQILHLYLNQIYFGNGAYGIEEAAITYFAKPAAQLQVFESAILASIPKSPNRINPFGDLERLRARQLYVLEQMQKKGFINAKTAEAAKAFPLFSAVSNRNTKDVAPYFLQALKGQVTALLGPDKIARGGIKVFSTLDMDMQRAAELALSSGLHAIDKRGGYRGPLLRPEKALNEKLKKSLEEFNLETFKKTNSKHVWNLKGLKKGLSEKTLLSLVKNVRIQALTEGMIVGARVKSVHDARKIAVLDLGSRQIDLPLSAFLWAKPAGQKAPPKVSDILHEGDIVLAKVMNVNGALWASLEQEPIINGALIALDVKSGDVRAMVGGADFVASSFNRITQSKRQPGSAIKPFIYALAIENKIVTPASIITDAPRAFFDPGSQEFWRPKNSYKKYLGDITVRRCLQSSVNICTITLLEKIGIDNFLERAKALELATAESPFPRNLTVALGSAEITPWQLANAMRIFPNQGRFCESRMMTSYSLPEGTSNNVELSAQKQVISEPSAYIVTNILRSTISASHRERYLGNVKIDLAGKTGTTNNVRSAWYIGFSPNTLALVFVGYDDNRSIGSEEWGVTTAFPIWANFMNRLEENQLPENFSVPEGLEWHVVNQEGKVADSSVALHDGQSDYFREAFLAGTAPKENENEVAKTAPSAENSAFAP